MYDSPIHLLMTDIHHQIVEQQDEQIYQAVLHFVPDVNKEELIRALQYDRGQYDKGYADGYREGMDDAMKNIAFPKLLVSEPKTSMEELEDLMNGSVILSISNDATITPIYPYMWIPVTERLPENIGLFLVIERHWIDGSPCRRIAKWNTEDWFTADRKSKEITPRVTHWMPLPEPPRYPAEGR